jgi:hypothetical protein
MDGGIPQKPVSFGVDLPRAVSIGSGGKKFLICIRVLLHAFGEILICSTVLLHASGEILICSTVFLHPSEEILICSTVLNPYRGVGRIYVGTRARKILVAKEIPLAHVHVYPHRRRWAVDAVLRVSALTTITVCSVKSIPRGTLMLRRPLLLSI